MTANKETTDLVRALTTESENTDHDAASRELMAEAAKALDEGSRHTWTIPDFGDKIRASINQLDFAAWFIFSAMSETRGAGKDFVKIFFPSDGGIPGKIDVELAVNGVRVNAKAVFKILGEDYGRQLRDAAKSLVEEKFSRVNDMLYRLEHGLVSEVEAFDEARWKPRSTTSPSPSPSQDDTGRLP